jgi:hypothetical protein
VRGKKGGGGGPEEGGEPDKRAPLVCERERGGREEAAERAGLGQSLRWAAAGKGDWVDCFFFFFSFSFQILFKPNSNSNLFHVFKLKF